MRCNWCPDLFSREKARLGWQGCVIYAWFTVIAQDFPALQGMLEYHWRQGRGHAMTIMEYKGVPRKTGTRTI
jgi:hypothetical protein